MSSTIAYPWTPDPVCRRCGTPWCDGDCDPTYEADRFSLDDDPSGDDRAALRSMENDTP